MLKGAPAMTIYFLYLKIHNITGLRYLGQTRQDPVAYKGSGSEWKKHLRKYGNDVTTEILYQTHIKDEMITIGKYYSKIWNVVKAIDDYGNKVYANMIPETGGGPGSQKGHIKHKTWREKISHSTKESPIAKCNNQFGEQNHMYNICGEHHHRYGIKHTSESKMRISLNHKDFSGSNNPRARKITIITPSKDVIQCFGNFQTICKSLNISYSTANKILRENARLIKSGRSKGYQIFYS
jgi:hypothetical protein